MENCAFIDIFTTQNDLFGHHNCPIQFCYEIFSNDEIYGDGFFKPEHRKTFNIIPDEEIMTMGFVTSGFSNSDVMTSDYNGIPLKDALVEIHKILSIFRDKNIYLMGYNHIAYDLRILNENIVRVTGLSPIEFDSDHIIDVMKLAECKIDIAKIGSYSMESVYTYLTGEHMKFNNIRTRKSTSADIRLTKEMFLKLVDNGSKLSDIVSEMKTPREIKTFNFGKYKGATVEYVVKNDVQYCNWILRNKDITKQNPALIESIRKIYNKTVE